MSALNIQQDFIDFYQKMGFHLLPRASLLDVSIPMSFVMSAGLVQVEKSLETLGDNAEGEYILVQDCFRHFDVEKVGMDSTHLSFFKMPGAFVFGEIDAKKTTQLMWTMAIDALHLNPDKLWASYFAGGTVFGCEQPKDVRTYLGWRNIGLPDKHIVGLGDKHNFWIQGNGLQGENNLRKCGPHTELFFDRGEELSCGINCLPGCACGRFVEFSNTLFIEFEIDVKSSCIHKIATPFTETVIGIERVEMIQKNIDSIFETSVYQPVIEVINKYIARKDIAHGDMLMSQRIIADHLRALYHLVADGAPPPGKNGRQRIIKTLIRRIVTQQIVLGIEKKDFMPNLLDCVAQNLSDVNGFQYNKEKITQFYSEEEERYFKTLQRGNSQIERLIYQNNGKNLSECQIQDLKQFWGVPEILARLVSTTSYQ